jgi:hypothetical protein
MVVHVRHQVAILAEPRAGLAVCAHDAVGDAAEEARIGNALHAKPKKSDDEASVPPLLLAESWDPVADPTGWWLSEKLEQAFPGNDLRQDVMDFLEVAHGRGWIRAKQAG